MWTLLFNPRIWLALALSLALSASHWKVYKIGGDQVTRAWDAERLAQANELTRLSEASRAKEQKLQEQTRKVTNDYIAAKNARAVDVARNADRLRDYQGALARLTSEDRDTATARRVDDALGRIAGECAIALGSMDEAAKRYRSIAEALQGYTREVCLK